MLIALYYCLAAAALDSEEPSSRDEDIEELTEEEIAAATTEKRRILLQKVSEGLSALASSSFMDRERLDLINTARKEVELTNELDMVDCEEEPGAEAAKIVFNRVNAMLKKAERELELADERVGENMNLIDKDGDGKISQEELMAAISYLRDSLDEEDLDQLFSKVQRDIEGNIDLEELIEDLKAEAPDAIDDEQALEEKPTREISNAA